MIKEKILTIEEFLVRLPWSKKLVSRPKIDKLWHYDLNVTPEQIWPNLINSSQMNKDLGYEEVNYSEKEGLLIGSFGEGSYFQSWIEYPWEWNYCYSISRLREYTEGSLEYNRMAALLEPLDEGGMRLYIYIGSISSHPLAHQFMTAFFAKFEKRYESTFKRYENEILRGVQKKKEIMPLNETQKNQIQSFLKKYKAQGFDAEIVNQLLNYIYTADQSELYRIRILPLAKAWHVDSDTLLEIFLHGVKFGLFQLTWDTVCPHCRGVKHENPFLSQVQLHGKCDVCEIEFTNNGENSIEVVFHVHPAVREIKKVYYCSGEPHTKPHIKVQKYLTSHEKNIEVEASVPHDDYNCRVIGAKELTPYVIEQEIVCEDSVEQHDRWHFRLKNPDPEDKIFVLENKAWDSASILRPYRLFNNEVFRELFDDEYMPYDLNLEIGTQTIVFIDVSNSTEYYVSQGDAVAFNEIRKLFVNLEKIAKQFHGAVFKTMGDGCLLTFNNSIQALKAVIHLRNKIATGEIQTELNYRVSIHAGRCLAVNFNNKIDYFGQTVNLTAKLQWAAQPGDVTVSEALINDDVFKDYLTNKNIAYYPVKVEHPSLNKAFQAYKLSWLQ